MLPSAPVRSRDASSPADSKCRDAGQLAATPAAGTAKGSRRWLVFTIYPSLSCNQLVLDSATSPRAMLLLRSCVAGTKSCCSGIIANETRGKHWKVTDTAQATPCLMVGFMGQRRMMASRRHQRHEIFTVYK